MQDRYKYLEFEKILRYVFEKNKPGLSSDDIISIEELISVGEAGVAYENMCVQLSEHNSSITNESYELIEKIGKNMNFDERYWLPLKELIKNV